MSDLAILLHIVGIVVGVGSAFSLFVISIIAKSFDKQYKADVLYKLFTLRYIAYIGLIMLIISGIFLSFKYQDQIFDMPYFIIKLILTAILSIVSLYGYYQMKIAKSDNLPSIFKKLSFIGQISFILGFLIIIFAILAFE